jgi:hypothetical protein
MLIDVRLILTATGNLNLLVELESPNYLMLVSLLVFSLWLHLHLILETINTQKMILI